MKLIKELLNIFIEPYKSLWAFFDNDSHKIVSKRGMEILNNTDNCMHWDSGMPCMEWCGDEVCQKKSKPMSKIKLKFNYIPRWKNPGEWELHLLPFIDFYKSSAERGMVVGWLYWMIEIFKPFK